MHYDIGTYYGNWPAALAWSLLISAFLLFVPFYRKADRKPAGVFAAFAAAFAFEMYGAPFSLYLIMAVFGRRLPEGVFWGRTLSGIFGTAGHVMFLMCLIAGGGLVVAGWARIHRDYWSKEDEEGRLVREGLYRFVRHPQYAGLLLISGGMLCDWATIPLLFLWPILAYRYYRLARREERELAERFINEWPAYRAQSGMFLPRFRSGKDLSS